MKTLTKTLAIISLSLGAITVANANPVLVSTDNSQSTEICMAAASGSKLQLRQAIKDTGLTKQKVNNLISCNGLTLVDFVEAYGSDVVEVNDYITNGEYSKNLTAKN